MSVRSIEGAHAFSNFGKAATAHIDSSRAISTRAAVGQLRKALLLTSHPPLNAEQSLRLLIYISCAPHRKYPGHPFAGAKHVLRPERNRVPLQRVTLATALLSVGVSSANGGGAVSRPADRGARCVAGSFIRVSRNSFVTWFVAVVSFRGGRWCRSTFRKELQRPPCVGCGGLTCCPPRPVWQNIIFPFLARPAKPLRSPAVVLVTALITPVHLCSQRSRCSVHLIVIEFVRTWSRAEFLP